MVDVHESVRIGRVAGIPIGFNWSLLVIVWLISWGLATDRFPADHPGYSDLDYWVAATVTAVVFFASLVAHELGHALVARRLGMRVEGITLWLFGGVAELGDDASTPRAEFQVGVVGPLVSLAAAAVFALGAAAADSLGLSDLVGGVLAWLATINVVLAVFNLVPAYPLDGGRVLRALLWHRHGDRLRATASASRAGRVFGYLLIGLGLLEFAAGGTIGGLWFVFIGWFLLMAARAEEAGVAVRDSLGSMSVREVMSADPMVVPASLTVDHLLESYALRHPFTSFPVVDDAGRLVGLTTLSRIKRLPAERRTSTPVAEVACPLAEVPTAAPDDPVLSLIDRMARSPDGRGLVFEGGHLVGIVSPTDVARVVEVAGLRAPSQRPRPMIPPPPPPPRSG